MSNSGTSRAMRIAITAAGLVAVAAVVGIFLGEAASDRPDTAAERYRATEAGAPAATGAAEVAEAESAIDAVPQIGPGNAATQATEAGPDTAVDGAAGTAVDGAAGTGDARDGASDAATWGVACDRDTLGALTGCRVTQTVAARSTGKRLITVTVRRPADGGETAMMVTLPLRTFLTPGTFIQIDDQPGRKTPFQLCDENGCYAGTPADEAFVDALKQGRTLAIEFYDAERQKTRVELPLGNFARSFEQAVSRAGSGDKAG